MSDHFQPQEFWCHCGRADCNGKRDPSPDLVKKLENMRLLFMRPLIINSGIRCPAENLAAGGVDGSEHLTGEAADLACLDSRNRYDMLHAAFTVFKRVGVGVGFIHVGVSPTHDQRVCWLYHGTEHHYL